MFLSRQRPVVSRISTTTFWSIRTYKVQAERKKTGPAKGKLLDPDDPSKTINRSKVINYRPRGRTMKRASEKTESDAMGRMIYQDVSVDVNGIPQKIPDIYYQRFPIIKTKPESYEDWKRRRAGIRQQVEGFCKDVQQLKLDVSKFAWERDLEKRKPPTESEFEFNQKVIDILAELRDRAVKAGAIFKANGLRKAIASLASHPAVITSVEQVENLPGIGKATSKYIQEIIDTGTLKRLVDDTEDKKTAAINLFMKVPGFTYADANDFVQQGLYTIEDLAQKDVQKKLTDEQSLGVKYYPEIRQKIPRTEMAIWSTMIIGALDLVDPDYHVMLVGNYRRGAAESPEVDILVTHPTLVSDVAPVEDLKKLEKYLQSKGLLQELLKLGENELSAIGHLPETIFTETNQPVPPHRLIRLYLVQWDSWPYAQLYYTGSSAFNILLREKAARLGYRLTPYHLEKRKQTTVEVFGVDGLLYMEEDRTDYKEGDRVILDSEEDVFRFLQMKYVPPLDRNL